jgi:hypothetical protein
MTSYLMLAIVIFDSALLGFMIQRQHKIDAKVRRFDAYRLEHSSCPVCSGKIRLSVVSQ